MKIIRVLFTFLFLSVISSNGFSYPHKTDSLLLQLKNNLSDSIKVSALIYIVELNEVSKDSALLFIKEALKTAEHSKKPALISRAMHYLSHWHIDNTKSLDTILYYCHTHLERMQQLKFSRGIASAYGNLGMAYTWHLLDSSLFYNWKSVAAFTELNELNRANNAKINLANVYSEMRRYAEAIAIFNETAAYGSKTGQYHAASLSYFNMSECYTRLGDLKNAEKCIDKGCAFSDTLPYNVAYCKAMLADVYVAQGKWSAAIPLYEHILKTGKENKFNYILYRGNNGMADVSFKNGKWQDAIRYKKLSWEYSYKDLNTRQSLYHMIYACDSALGNYKASLMGYQAYIAVRDSFENIERLKSADALEAKYQNKEKQTQIELLDKENKIQQAVLERQQLIRNSIMVVCVILFALAALLFNRFKLKKKIEQQDALLTERKRISRELHDDLGAQLSTAKMFLQSAKNKPDADNSAVDNSLSLIESSIHDLRSIMDDLQTSTLRDIGYIAATEELVNRVNHLQEINFSLTHHGIEKRLEEKTEHHLFRITQELINNMVKYAQAKNVNIDLMKRDNKIVLMYEDDGVGFDLESSKQGYGLDNVKSRIKSVNGSVEFDTAIGKGFRCIIEV